METALVIEKIQNHENHSHTIKVTNPELPHLDHAGHLEYGHVCTSECKHTQTEADQLASELFADIRTAEHGESGHVCNANCQHTQKEADTLAESLFASLEDKSKFQSHEHGHQKHVCSPECKHSQQEADTLASKLFEEVESRISHGEKGHVCTTDCKHTQAEADRLAEELFASAPKETEKPQVQDIIDRLATSEEQVKTVPKATDLPPNLEQATRLQAELVNKLSKQVVEAESKIIHPEILQVNDRATPTQALVAKVKAIEGAADIQSVIDTARIIQEAEHLAVYDEAPPVTKDLTPGEVSTTEAGMLSEQESEIESTKIDVANEEILDDVELLQPSFEYVGLVEASEITTLISQLESGVVHVAEDPESELLQVIEAADETTLAKRDFSLGIEQDLQFSESIVQYEYVEASENDVAINRAGKSIVEVVPELESKPEITDALTEVLLYADKMTLETISKLFDNLRVEAKKSTKAIANESHNGTKILSILESLSEYLGIELGLFIQLTGIRPTDLTLTSQSWEMIMSLQKLMREEYRKEFIKLTQVKSDDRSSGFTITQKLGKLIIGLLSKEQRPLLAIS